MRVLILGMGWFAESPGGLNRYAFDLMTVLRVHGLEVEAVVVGSPDPGFGTVGAAPSGAPLLRRLWATGIEGRVRSRTADVINSHFALYTLPVLWARPGKPLVVHFQGPWYHEALTESPEPRWLTAVRKHIETSVYSRANELVVLSDAFRHILIEDFGLLPSRVHMIRPGVDLDRFRPMDRTKARERLKLPNQQRVVVSVRRLTARVGLDILLRAWAVARPENSTLYIIGEGPERKRLQALSAEFGILPTVRLVGKVSDVDLPLWYAAADMTVVPSLALEGFGLVVLESLACGTPVLASDTGGMAEVVADLAPNLLVPPGDASLLASAISSALKNDQSLPAREDCRKFAERFQWPKAADRVIDIFNRAQVRPPQRKYRVVFLDHCAKLSGGELALLRLLKGATNIEPYVILAEDGPLVQRLREVDIPTEVLPLPPDVANLSRNELHSPSRLLGGGIATASYITRLSRRLRRLHPDLVHTNSLKSGLYGTMAGRAAGIPVIWHLRDRLSDDSYPSLLAAVMRRSVRSMADAVIANSKASARLLSHGRAPVWVVPSPVDIAPAPRAPDAQPVVGIVGRLAPWKGQHVFLDAMARVSRQYPAVRFRVIGSPLFGEEEYLQRLLILTENLGIGDVVDFVGFKDDVAEELAELTIAVHASTVPEPFGQVIVEAMACGVPIVATASGGPSEIVSDGTDGLLVAAGDPSELAEAVSRLIGDADFRTRLSNAGTRKAEQFRPARIAAAVEAVYASVLADPGSSRN